MHVSNRSVVARAWLLCVATALFVAGTSAASAVDLDQKVEFNVPAGALSNALIEFSKQAHIQILSSGDRASKATTDGLSGTLTIRDALSRLLRNSGLRFKAMGANAVAIEAIANDGARNAADPSTTTEKYAAARAPDEQLPPSTASSGSQPSSRSSEKPEQTVGRLEDIIVTAQRREELLAKVPISVTALSQKTLDELNIESISDLASIVPGLVRRSTFGGGQVEQADYAVRGVVNNSNAPTTQIYIDETPISVRNLSDAAGASPEPHIFDLARLEVLRGPQGTLFGSSAEGGAIRFITPQPSLDSYTGYGKGELSFTRGGDPSYEAGLAYGGPIVDGKAGFRISGWFRGEGGFVDREDPLTGAILSRNINYGTSMAFRPAVKWAPTERLSITLAAFLQQDYQRDPPTIWTNHLPYNTGRESGYSARPNINDITVPSLAIQYDLNNFTVQSDTSFLSSENRHTDDYKYYITSLLTGGKSFIPGNPPYSGATPTFTWNRAFQQEVRLSSKDNGSGLTWVFGLFYRRSSTLGEQFIVGSLTPVTEALYGLTSLQTFGVPDYPSGFGPNSYSQSYALEKQKAVFGEVTYEIAKGLKIFAGVRIERSSVGDSEFYSGPLVGNVNAVIPEHSETPVTPRLGVNYQVNDGSMVYMTAAKGYRAGGVNSPVDNIPFCAAGLAELGLKVAPPTYDSDSVWSYEVGTKNVLLDRRLRVDASVYYINWTKIQQVVLEPICSEPFVTNEGKAVSKGFDLQFAAQLTDRLKVGAVVGYTDAFFPNTVRAGNGNGVGNLENAGDPVQGVLPWTYAVNVEYRSELPGWSGSHGYARADFRWLDGQPAGDPKLATFVSLNNLHRDPSYHVLNLRAGVTRNGWDVSLFVNNATNSNPLTGFNALLGDVYPVSRMPPRTIGVTGFYRF
jgi:outer membrane receptor protein involved in Fe transport